MTSDSRNSSSWKMILLDISELSSVLLILGLINNKNVKTNEKILNPFCYQFRMDKSKRTQKGGRADEAHSSYQTKLYRYAGIFIAKSLTNAPVTPNQISTLRLLMGIGAAFLFAFGSYPFLLMGLILFLIAEILDYADGSLARIRGTASNYGLWYDFIGDSLVFPAVFFALTYGAFQQSQNTNVLIFGFVGTLSFLIVEHCSWIYKRTYPEIIEKEKRESTLKKEFYFTPSFVTNVMALAIILNKVYLFLIFCSVYGGTFCIAMLVLLTIKLGQYSELHRNKNAK